MKKIKEILAASKYISEVTGTGKTITIVPNDNFRYKTIQQVFSGFPTKVDDVIDDNGNAFDEQMILVKIGNKIATVTNYDVENAYKINSITLEIM